MAISYYGFSGGTVAGIDNLTPYAPGQSGNPAGKPKGARNRSTIVREALEAIMRGTDQQVIDTLTAAIIAKAATGDVPAFKELLDSAYGKNIDKQETTGADGGPVEHSLTVRFVE